MTTTMIAAYLNDLLHQVGKIIVGAHKDAENHVESKSGSANFVTVYDVAVQEHLIRRLKAFLPDAVFVAEEKDNDAAALMAEHCFVIDPIDGTTNFIHDYRMSCISIAMATRGETVLGMVYDPYRGELYSAEKGKGAFLNGTPIHVSERPTSLAVAAFGTSPYYKETLADITFAVAKQVFLSMADIRRAGSAALDLAHLASGRVDAFFEMILSPWDFAAGALIVTEAGGVVSQSNGSPIDLATPCSVFAGNVNTHAALLALYDKVKR